MPEQVSIEQAILDGRTQAAIDEALERNRLQPLSTQEEAELACAYAIVGDIEKSSRALERIRESGTHTAAIAAVAGAYQALAETDEDSFVSQIKLALELNPQQALANYAMALHAHRRRADYSTAREHLHRARSAYPNARLIQYSLLGVELEEGNLDKANEISEALPPNPYGRLNDLLLKANMQYLRTPLRGGLIAFLLGLMLFIPWFGPGILAAFFVFTSLSFFQVRHISGRLALLTPIHSVALLGLFFIRYLVLERVFP